MKYIYYVIYTLKQVAGALSLFCGGFDSFEFDGKTYGFVCVGGEE